MALEKANQKYDGSTGGYQDISKTKEVSDETKKEVSNYISQIIGEDIDGDLLAALKDGTILCKMLNGIIPDTCKKFKASKIAYVARTNIAIYLAGCKKVGLSETFMFETRDLFDLQRPWVVMDNIYGLSALSRKLGFKGPFIGYKLAEENKRNFTKEQLQEANRKLIAESLQENK